MTEYLLDSLKDSVRLLPFLFLTYLLMETLEHKAGSGARRRIQTAGKFGPLWGGNTWSCSAVRILGCSIQPVCRKSNHSGNTFGNLFIHIR